MYELPRHPTYDIDDSPAAGVKTRARFRRRRSSSNDNEPRPAAKRRCRKKGTIEAKPGAEAGGPELTRGLTYYVASTTVEVDTKPPPPQTPLFGFGSPQESWLEASESPSPTKSVK